MDEMDWKNPTMPQTYEGALRLALSFIRAYGDALSELQSALGNDQLTMEDVLTEVRGLGLRLSLLRVVNDALLLEIDEAREVIGRGWFREGSSLADALRDKAGVSDEFAVCPSTETRH